MNRRNPAAFWVYLAVAVIGLIGTAWFNVRSVISPSGDSFLAAWFANASVSSLAWDLLAVASGASIFIILEGRRLGMRWPWAYVAVSFVTAVGFAFPLFLAVRERHLATVDKATLDNHGRDPQMRGNLPDHDADADRGSGNPPRGQ